MLVPTRLAQLPQTPELPQIPRLSQIPGLSEISGLLPQITRLFPNLGARGLSGANGQCLSSLVGIPGCLTQVFGSLVNGQFSIIGSSCCKAISEIEGNCLSNLFPSNPVLLLCLITLVVNHLKETDRSPESPQVRLLYQGFYLGIKTYKNAGHLF